MSLQVTFPNAARFWHPTNNNGLTPNDVKAFSHKKYWFYCPKTCAEGCVHEWQARLSDFVRYAQCTFCDGRSFCVHQSLQHTHPNLMKYWDYAKNTISPTEVAQGAHTKVHWVCQVQCEYGCKHEWVAAVKDIVRGRRCPFCASKQLCVHNSLAFKHPEILEKLHPDKNEGLDLNKVFPFSSIRVWCVCRSCEFGCLHTWNAPISRLVNGHGCPYCASCVTEPGCYHRSLEYKYPEIAKLLHPTKNDFTGKDVSYASKKNAIWVCDKGHESESTVQSRTIQGYSCPICLRKTLSLLYEWLCQSYTNNKVENEKSFSWTKSVISDKHYYKYDFVIEDNKLIIELDGKQHFEDVWNWQSASENLERDVYKMKIAVENGYSIVRLLQEDVLYNRHDWKTKLKLAIKKYDAPTIVVICENDEYKDHIRDFDKYIIITTESMLVESMNKVEI